MDLKKGIMNKFDTKVIRQRLLLENKYIMDLWSRIPIQKFSDSKDDDDLVTLKKDEPVKVYSTHRANTLEELYSRLDAIKGKKLKYKEKLAKKGLKNKAEKKKKKEERRKKTLIKGNKGSRDVRVIKPDPSQSAKPVKPTKPVFNNEGKIVFSKFDFAEFPGSGDIRSKKDTKDPHKHLKKIEKQKEKLKQLEDEGDMERASAMREKELWKTALQKTAGVKVKDDPKLLEKAIKRKAQQKKRSKKNWLAREEKVQKEMEEKQAKRKANIDARLRKRNVKKVKTLTKRGRVIPGLPSKIVQNLLH